MPSSETATEQPLTPTGRTVAFFRVMVKSAVVAGVFVFGPYAVGMEFRSATVVSLLLVAFHSVSQHALSEAGFGGSDAE